MHMRIKRILAGLAAGVLPATLAAQDPTRTSSAEPSVTAVTNVTVIPMTDTAALPGRTVLIREGRIAQIGPATAIRVPAGARVVDGTGRFLIPGLFDMHVHTSKTRASALGLYVAHGITTVRDQGSEHAEVLRWRREIRAGTRVGPRMLIAGPYLESRNNIERMRRDPPEARVEPFERARLAVGSPADARRIVDSLARLELDHLKVRTVQDRETYLALGAAADAAGLRLTGHVVTSSPSALLEAGQDGVDHLFFIPPDSLRAAEARGFWRELAARDVGVVPTLVLRESVLRPADYYEALLDDTTGAVHPLRPYLSAFMILDWREQAEEQTPERRALYERIWPMAITQVRDMRRAGVRIMAGSDVAVLNIFPGASLHQELEFFVDSVGMSPAEALASATRLPAEWLGLADSVGTITSGKIADLVLLEGNPLEDIANVRRIAAVFLQGRAFDRRDLGDLMSAVRAMPDIRTNDWLR